MGSFTSELDLILVGPNSKQSVTFAAAVVIQIYARELFY